MIIRLRTIHRGPSLAFTASLTVALLFALVLPADAAAGDLDTTFSGDGIVVTNPGDHGWGNQIAIQKDGKILVGGYENNEMPLRKFAVVRYNTDGTLDSTFGNGGIVTTDVTDGGDHARAIVLQKDGRFILGGQADFDFGLVRYNTDGSLDTTFGTGGIVTTNINGEDAIRALLVRNDGKIVAVGYSGQVGTRNFSVARYFPNGTLDTTFGTGGTTTIDFGNEEQSRGAAIVTGGKLVIAGYTKIGTGDTANWNWAVCRLLLNGSLDTTFGGSGTGKVVTDLGAGDVIRALVVQTDGMLVVSGYTGLGGGAPAVGPGDPDIEAPQGAGDWAVGRYTANGTLDTTFGTGGVTITDFGGSDHARGVALQSDGKIVAAGNARGGTKDEFAVARYNTDGTLDTTFGGGDGMVITDLGASDGARDVKIQADGKIVAAGISGGVGGYDIAVARYLAS